MLYIVPTPIGNLEDITLRALRTLKEVSFILTEDTRTSSVLLKHYKIETPLEAYHQHNEHQRTAAIIQRLKNENAAIISDAGTPGISDAGFLLVHGCIEENMEVQCLPGATAFVPALIQSGFPTDEFIFIGFLPQKKGRQSKLHSLAEEHRTIVMYESPFRVIKLLNELKEYFGESRMISISRELTKKFEETIRGTASTLTRYYENKAPKGEFVIVVEGKE